MKSETVIVFVAPLSTHSSPKTAKVSTLRLPDALSITILVPLAPLHINSWIVIFEVTNCNAVYPVTSAQDDKMLAEFSTETEIV